MIIENLIRKELIEVQLISLKARQEAAVAYEGYNASLPTHRSMYDEACLCRAQVVALQLELEKVNKLLNKEG